MSEKTIQSILCMKCEKELEFVRDLKDIYNSDFYNSHYRCNNCNYSIEIITHELRD